MSTFYFKRWTKWWDWHIKSMTRFSKNNKQDFPKWKSAKMKMPTAPGVPRRSPIQVLTGPNVAYLQWSDENWCSQRGMAVGEGGFEFSITYIATSYTLNWLRLVSIFHAVHSQQQLYCKNIRNRTIRQKYVHNSKF